MLDPLLWSITENRIPVLENKSPPAAESWANLQDHIKPLVSYRKMTSFGSDSDYVYVGHSWGIAIYDHKGKHHNSVLTNGYVKQIVTADKWIWLGTDNGLLRMKRGSWDISPLKIAEKTISNNHATRQKMTT